MKDCVSLRTGCIITAAYFVVSIGSKAQDSNSFIQFALTTFLSLQQDGFVTLVDSIIRTLFSSASDGSNGWRLFDGSILLWLGYLCVLGIEHVSGSLSVWC